MAGRVRFTLTGAKEMQKRLQAIDPRMENAVKVAIYNVGLNLRTDAMEHTPVETGTLRASHYVSLPERAGNRIVTEVGAGGPAKAYAIHVHEGHPMRGGKPPHHPVGEHKWLENALKRLSGHFLSDMAKLVRYHFERGSGPPTKQVIDDPNQAPDLRGGR